jgi:hypothetical protein
MSAAPTITRSGVLAAAGSGNNAFAVRVRRAMQGRMPDGWKIAVNFESAEASTWIATSID